MHAAKIRTAAASNSAEVAPRSPKPAHTAMMTIRPMSQFRNDVTPGMDSIERAPGVAADGAGLLSRARSAAFSRSNSAF
jgi:hypothetical protein